MLENYKPTLTLDPNAEEEVSAIELEVKKEADVVAETVKQLQQLSPEEQRTVDEFAEKINIEDSAMVLQYGAAAQKKLAGFSDTALEKVKTKDLGEVGDMMSDLIVELKGFTLTEEDRRGFFGFFKRSANQITALKAKYDSCEVNVDKIAGMLEDHQITLLKDIAVMDKMYDLNLAYFKELTMYILAGKKKLEETRATKLAQLTAKAQASGLPEDAQAARDMANFCDRFEKKLYDHNLCS